MTGSAASNQLGAATAALAFPVLGPAGVVAVRQWVAAPAAAASLSALLYVPIGIWVLASHPVTVTALGRAATAGVLCSAVPMVADLLALRRVPTRSFGVFTSVNPGVAALTGLVVLGQSLAWADWLAIAAIVTANGVSVSSGR
jgi:inner membrane transporter RhtA